MEVQSAGSISNAAAQYTRIAQAGKLEHSQDLQEAQQIIKLDDAAASSDRRFFDMSQASLNDAIARLNTSLKYHEITNKQDDQLQQQNAVLRNLSDYNLKSDTERAVDTIV